MPAEPTPGDDGGPGTLVWSNPWAEPPTYIGNNQPFGGPGAGALFVQVSDPPPAWAINYKYDRVIVSFSSVYASPITVWASVFNALGGYLGGDSVVLAPGASADMSIYLSGLGGDIMLLSMNAMDEYMTSVSHACVLNYIRFPGSSYWTAILGCEESA